MAQETVDYGVRCTHCGSPIRIGHIQGAPREQLTFVLNPSELKCPSCSMSAIYQGKAAVFQRFGIHAYWGVTCECGRFYPLKKATLNPHEKVPDVPAFGIICTHRGQSNRERILTRQKLLKIETDEEIKNFRPHPLFR